MNFITGGTGLLGSHLLFKLISENKPVRAIYRDKKRTARVLELFHYYDPVNAETLFQQIEWVQCDILDTVALASAMSGATNIYHCAAFISYVKKDFPTMMKINREGTANLVNIALEMQGAKFCFASSTSAISINEENRKAPLIEANKWVQSTETSGYAISKYSAEKEVWRGIEEGLSAVIINPSVMIGPGNWNESSLTIFKLIDDGFSYYSEGGNAFVDVRDVVKSMVTITEDASITAQRFLCSGNNLTFKTLFDLISNGLNKKAPSIKATLWMSRLAQAMDWFKGIFTGRRTLTSETVRTSRKITEYDSSKLIETTNLTFTPISETIENAVKGRLFN